ncbi:MAG: hypothetical protein IPL19_19595 [Sandaracinaceae bacterium]|nr:hypothetical protein [Sandaracinaceae bacterium]
MASAARPRFFSAKKVKTCARAQHQRADLGDLRVGFLDALEGQTRVFGLAVAGERLGAHGGVERLLLHLGLRRA